jgi:hypothetical protein
MTKAHVNLKTIKKLLYQCDIFDTEYKNLNRDDAYCILALYKILGNSIIIV